VEKLMAAHAQAIRMVKGQVSVSELVVKTEADNERALATVEGLMSRKRTPAEDALLDVLVDQIERFESRTYPGPGKEPSPSETIRFLMQQNGLAQKDLWSILGGKSHTSEVLNGKRKASNRQAALLGKRFKMSPAAFIEFA
jgi:HTH-type transcriptional regulator/antitoxin HigA